MEYDFLGENLAFLDMFLVIFYGFLVKPSGAIQLYH